ncbi:MAG: hypothetical protein CHACPFDD_03596 [Phycisphaerae bacterium]|nr:hypothetical protein [Phycisphaerae bacterium]
MRSQRVNAPQTADLSRPTRRDLLGYAAAVSLGSVAPTLAGDDPEPTAYQPWWVQRFPNRSTAINVRSANVLGGGNVRTSVLSQMLAISIQRLTQTTQTADAWRAILGDARRIVVKFNSVDADRMKTSDAMAEVITAGLLHADYPPSAIALVECPRPAAVRERFRRVLSGWGSPIPIGDDGATEELANYVLEADAIINVGFLKAHHLAGMSACMKNLAFAAIRRPARYHDNGCSPYVARVIGAEPVSTRLRLCIVNALRVRAAHAAELVPNAFRDFGELLVGFDPVAVDSVAHSAISDLRRTAGVEAELNVPYLAAAGHLGVGRTRPNEIERLVVDNAG